MLWSAATVTTSHGGSEPQARLRHVTEAEGIHDFPRKKTGKKPPLPGRAAIPFNIGLVEVPDHPLLDADASGYVYPMDGNDRWGVCVVAMWDHARYVITQQLTGQGKRYTLDEVVQLYRTQNPNFDPHNYREQDDQGMYVQLFLEYLVRTGEILGFAKVDHTNLDELQAATYLGLAIGTGSLLTKSQSWQNVWDYVPNDPTWGGHAVSLVDYSPGHVRAPSWAQLHDVTDAFLDHQMDEAWFIITREHVNHPSFRSGYDLVEFAKAYERITGRTFPVDVNPPTPPTPPTESFRFTDPEVAARVARTAVRRGKSVDSYVTDHFRAYYR
jgi:hypothetical protein